MLTLASPFSQPGMLTQSSFYTDGGCSHSTGSALAKAMSMVNLEDGDGGLGSMMSQDQSQPAATVSKPVSIIKPRHLELFSQLSTQQSQEFL